MILNNSIFTKNKNVHIIDLGDESILVHRDKKYIINAVGMVVWNSMSDMNTCLDIINRVADHYETGDLDIADDIIRLITKLKDYNLIDEIII